MCYTENTQEEHISAVMFIRQILMKGQCAENMCKDIINMKKYFGAGFILGIIIYFILRYLVEISSISSLYFSIISFVVSIILLYLMNVKLKR